MTPPLLPVPDLNDTINRFLAQVRPLLDDTDYAEAETAARAFETDTAPALQAALLARAADRPDSSWLADTWLDGYLRIREALPLASNVAFELQTQGADLAQWCAALAAVCADWRHGRIDAPLSPQGLPVCMAQWRILAGAARVPQSVCDDYRFAEDSRHIGVLHRGWYYRVAALDERGEALPAAHFRHAFAQIEQHCESNPYPVAVAAHMGGDDAARLHAALRRHPDNSALLDDLNADLFHVSLSDRADTADDDLARAAFSPDCAVWTYKPMTFCHNRATQRLFWHCEHTWEDGGALKGIIARAAAKLPETNTETAFQAAAPVRRSWQLSAAQERDWQTWQQRYAERAAHMRVCSTLIELDNERIPARTSRDALMQFALQYAQLAAYGRVRNTYEAVDASHFLHGRTECVRPVSEPSLALVRALADGSAAGDALTAALAEHKARVKTAKQGLGANRHLLGLHAEARAAGADTAWFDGAAYRLFCNDFLSTSTLGDDALIRNFAFAPTSAGGLGVNYTLTARGWLFTVSHHAAQAEDVARFVVALREAR